MQRMTIAAAVAAALWAAAGAAGDEPDPDLMKGMTNFPQAFGEHPPTPLMDGQERQILDAVFSRFPNVDSHGMMIYIREHFPDEMQQYSLRAMENLSEAVPMLMRLVRQALELQDLEARRPEAYALAVRQMELERRAKAQGAACRQSAGAEREARRAALRGTLAESFDAKQARMRGDIADISRQLEELRQLVQERETNREAIISRRAEDLLGQPEPTQW